MIFGYGECGKDTAASLIGEQLDLTWESSSFFAANHFIFDSLKHINGYNSVEECFQDRRNHRAAWFNLIREYNEDNKAKLAQNIYETHDIYVGMRCREELREVKRTVNPFCLWIDAEERVGLECGGSCTVGIDQADCIIQNNGTPEEFKEKLIKFCNFCSTWGLAKL